MFHPARVLGGRLRRDADYIFKKTGQELMARLNFRRSFAPRVGKDNSAVPLVLNVSALFQRFERAEDGRFGNAQAGRDIGNPNGFCTFGNNEADHFQIIFQRLRHGFFIIPNRRGLSTKKVREG